jgi:hypothetical protein
MSKRRLTVLIVLCALIMLSGEQVVETSKEVSIPTVKGPETHWSELAGEYREQLLHDIRKEHLVTKTGIDEALASRIITAVSAEALHHNLDPNRVLAFIIIESWANPKAESWAGALGLMQVMPATGKYIARKRGFKWSGVEELRIVESNISYGTWYYKHLLEMFDGDDHAAISAYNWGPENIRGRMKRGENLPKVYPGKVYAAQKELQGVIWNEYKSRFWRGADQYVSNAREQGHSPRSERRPSDCLLHGGDGQSVCVRDGEAVPASPGDLSQ